MRRTAHLLAGIALLTGCGGQPAATETAADFQPPRSEASAAEHRDVAALRAATVKFHHIEVANSAGWDTQFPAGCFTSPMGAMGYHWIKNKNVGTLKVTEPQLVLYEPQENGTMKLVGVEFILPGQPTDTPPVLFGQTFQYNTTFGVWALHVWAWRNNPLGLYANWNPTVTCKFATTVAAMAHH